MTLDSSFRKVNLRFVKCFFSGVTKLYRIHTCSLIIVWRSWLRSRIKRRSGGGLSTTSTRANFDQMHKLSYFDLF